tara:strand:+ start:62587 stop:64044 length:1458 start_codon:yes stop_codon:yes gene_type:complete
MHTPAILTLATIVLCSQSSIAQFVEQDIEIIHELKGVNANDNFGANVCAVADYNGDGAMEFLVAANGDDTEATNGGVVHLYDGRKGTVIRSHFGQIANEAAGYVCDAGDVNNDGITDYLFGTNAAKVYVFSGADGASLYTFTGIAGSQYGFRACGIGDINNDGFGEVLVGAWSDDTIQTNQGRAFIYSGIDGSLIRTHNGARRQGQFGHTVSLLGDLDLDGVPDYSVGAPGPWATSDRGHVFVYSGATGNLMFLPISAESTGLALASYQQCQGFQNYNNDGVPDFAMCDIGDRGIGNEAGRHYRVDGATGTIINSTVGYTINSGFGGTPWTPAGNIGDITGDCISDGLIASWRSQVGATQGGQAHLIDLADGSILRTFTSNRAQAFLAGTLSGAGDANGDGIMDYILAANGDNGNRGAVYVIAGRDHRTTPSADLTNDGLLDFFDVSAFLDAFAKKQDPADFTYDGLFDFFDVSAFLDAFGAGCP